MDFQLPQLGEGVYEAEMVRWLVRAGDTVHHGQGLMEVMTDKATMEVSRALRRHRHGSARPARPDRPRRRSRPHLHDLDRRRGDPAAGPAGRGHAGRGAYARRPGGEVGQWPQGRGAVKASPSVRLLARKLGHRLAHVPRLRARWPRAV